MKLVWKLLRQNISKAQFFGFFIANFIGLTIILLATQFYFDVNPLISGKDQLLKDDYITISKEVSLASTITKASLSFSQKELSDLKKQSFVKEIGAYTPSHFTVLAGIRNSEMGVAFNTEMFFESVPDNFIDVQLSDWTFNPADNTIPIILPKNYLDLYNFGFAQANGMPKVTEGLIGLITMDITIYGADGSRNRMNGKVVGFSNRINTILVPDNFIVWANHNFGRQTQDNNPARIIISVTNIGDPNLSSYLKQKGYVISGDNNNASSLSFFLKVLVVIVIGIGLLICLLSFYILTLSIYLLLEKNMSVIENLRLIGYGRSVVLKPYIYLSLALNALVLVLALSVVSVVRIIYLKSLKTLLPVEMSASPLIYTILAGVVIFSVLSIANTFVIRSKVKI